MKRSNRLEGVQKNTNPRRVCIKVNSRRATRHDMDVQNARTYALFRKVLSPEATTTFFPAANNGKERCYSAKPPSTATSLDFLSGQIASIPDSL